MDNKRTKPDCKLIGEDGNIFNLMARAIRTLRENNLSEEAKEMRELSLHPAAMMRLFVS